MRKGRLFQLGALALGPLLCLLAPGGANAQSLTGSAPDFAFQANDAVSADVSISSPLAAVRTTSYNLLYSASGATVFVSSSTSELDWVSQRSISFVGATEVVAGDVIQDNTTYMMIAVVRVGDVFTGTYSLFIASSSNGLDWGSATGPLGLGGGIDVLTGATLIPIASGGPYRGYFGFAPDRASLANGRIGTFRLLSYSDTSGAVLNDVRPTLRAPVSRLQSLVKSDGSARIYTIPITEEDQQGRGTRIVSRSIDTAGNVGGAQTVLDGTSEGFGGEIRNIAVSRSTESWKYRVIFSTGSATNHANTATADVPVVYAISPDRVRNSVKEFELRVAGEIFAPATNVFLFQEGVPLNMVFVERTQVLTRGTLRLNNAPTGKYGLVVQNPDGTFFRAFDVFEIEIAPGRVELFDNLIRPGLATRTRINVETFVGDRLTVRVFTPSGGLVTTLYDGFAPAGTVSLLWDGTTSQGSRVASGVYFIKADGANLNWIDKVVIVR